MKELVWCWMLNCRRPASDVRMRKHRGTRHTQRGQAMPIIAVTIVLLIGMASLVVDLSNAQIAQRQAQMSADSAAVSAANELKYSTKTTDYQKEAKWDATSNGYGDEKTNTEYYNPDAHVDVRVPPRTGDYAGNPMAAEAIITVSKLDKLFSVGPDFTITARAVALRPSLPPLPCIVSLDTVGKAGNGSPPNNGMIFNDATVNAHSCDVIDSAEVLVNGNSSIDTKSFTFAKGAQPQNSGAAKAATVDKGFQPMKPGAAAKDPCTSVPGCVFAKSHGPTYACPGGNKGPGIFSVPANAPMVIPSGCYTSLQVLGPSKNNTSITPGTTAVFSGDYHVSGLFETTVETLQGTNVTIIADQIHLQQKKTDLQAPTSGSYASMLFYTTGTGQPIDMNSAFRTPGGSVNKWTGMVYAPNGEITFSDGIFNVQSVVVGNLTVNGGLGKVILNAGSTSGTSTDSTLLVE